MKNGKKITKNMPKKWNSNQMYVDILKDFISKIKITEKLKFH